MTARNRPGPSAHPQGTLPSGGTLKARKCTVWRGAGRGVFLAPRSSVPDTPTRTDIAPFAAVRSHELAAIRARRRVHDPNAPPESARPARLVGFSVSENV